MHLSSFRATLRSTSTKTNRLSPTGSGSKPSTEISMVISFFLFFLLNNLLRRRRRRRRRRCRIIVSSQTARAINHKFSLRKVVFFSVFLFKREKVDTRQVGVTATQSYCCGDVGISKSRNFGKVDYEIRTTIDTTVAK